MSYQGISVKEAIQRINNDQSGYFLPAVQRPYVWGSRHESEVYICKLFDSLLSKYPIGTLILWQTDTEIPHREFVRDFFEGDIPRMVDKGLFKRPSKHLVYDGQQRLQTLYSCLKYTFNGRVLCFDLLFDRNADNEQRNNTGFFFVAKDSTLEDHQIRMNEIFQEDASRKTAYRQAVLAKPGLTNISKENAALLETNIDDLWDIFVKTESKSLAYFPIQTKAEDEVNEVFQRLNSGGLSLSQSDLLFSMIKEEHFDFEEKLQLISRNIQELTHGLRISAWDILQFVHLLVKGTIRVDPRKVKAADIEQFSKVLSSNLEKVLEEFFVSFIKEQFHINSATILPSKAPLLVLLTFCHAWMKQGGSLKKLPASDWAEMKKFFIHASLANWTLQSQTDSFARMILARFKEGKVEFPYKEFVAEVESKKKRHHELQIAHLENGGWFSLKILMPDRFFSFPSDSDGSRLKPEIDHIFPAALEDQSKEYYQKVNQIWNMQPVRGGINNYKRRKHPKVFFTSEDGSKFLGQYDFLPTDDFTDSIWENLDEFIKLRRAKMIDFLESQYGFKLVG